MTTVEHIRLIASAKSPEVRIAGVAWPLYKVVALVVGFLVALIAGVATGTAATAVLAGAAAGTLVWVVYGSVQHFGVWR